MPTLSFKVVLWCVSKSCRCLKLSMHQSVCEILECMCVCYISHINDSMRLHCQQEVVHAGGNRRHNFAPKWTPTQPQLHCPTTSATKVEQQKQPSHATCSTINVDFFCVGPWITFKTLRLILGVLSHSAQCQAQCLTLTLPTRMQHFFETYNTTDELSAGGQAGCY